MQDVRKDVHREEIIDSQGDLNIVCAECATVHDAGTRQITCREVQQHVQYGRLSAVGQTTTLSRVKFSYDGKHGPIKERS
jgi:hypothetical protein